ncbi:MAG TPA: HYR domain-containing protein, partial [Flavobacteriales bacterium]|nr:HYR domain-containing protein [Flavobacteriales bacterium]
MGALAQSHDWRWSYGLTSNDPESFHALAVDHNDGTICTVGDAENSGIQIGPINLLDQDQGLLIKHDPWGNIVWYTPIGGSDQETAENIAIGPTGTIYVTGAFTGSCYFYNAGSSVVAQTLTSFSGSKDIYLAAFSPDGVVQWALQFGNGNDEFYPNVAADDEGVTLLAAYRGSLTSGSTSSSNLLSTGNYNLFNIRVDLTGTQQWMMTGGSSGNDTPANIAADGSRIYLGYVPGGSNFRWYGAGNTLIRNTNSTPGDHVYLALNKSGAWVWTSIVTDPSDEVEGYPNIVADCSGVYIASTIGGSSTLADGTVLSNANRQMYVARLNPVTGVYNWSRTAAFNSGGSYATPRDIDIGPGGIVHVAGTYKGSPNVLGQSFTNASNDDVFLLTLNSDGSYNTHSTIIASNDQYLSGVAADKFGGIAICGNFKDALNVPGHSLTGPGNDNGFIAFAQHGPREPFSEGRANFNVPVSVCAGTSVDLTTWLRPRTVGAVVDVPFSNAVVDPNNVIGAMDNLSAQLPGGTGSMLLDFGTTVPQGEVIRIRWRRASTASVAPTLAFTFSSDLATWTGGSTLTSLRSSYSLSSIALPVKTRYIRVAAQTVNGAVDLDAVCYSYGSATSGTWSGPNVSGNTFTPSGTPSPTPITYTVSLGNCTTSVTQNVDVLTSPSGGVITGGGTHCPGASGTLTLSGHSGPVLQWESRTDGNPWVAIPNTTNTYNWSSLAVTTSFRAVIDGGSCGTSTSGITTIVIEDNSPPVAICPSSDTLFVTSASCLATYVMPAILASDNCSGPIATNHIHQTVHDASAIQIEGSAIIEDATLEIISGSTVQLPPGLHAFTDTIRDGNGNRTVCNWTITVRDTIDPVVVCPATVELIAGISCKADVPDLSGMVISAMDNCPDALTLGQDISIGSLVQAGDIIHILATDASGNVGQCAMLVVTIDTVAPSIANCPGPGTIDVTPDPNSCEHLYTFPALESTDECDADTESDYRAFILESGNTLWQEVTGQLNHAFAPGLHQIMEIHRDDSGNQDTCTWSLNVMDLAPPSVYCPLYDGQVYPLGASCQMAFPDLRDSLVITDCSTWTITMDPPAGTLFTGDTVVQMTMWVEDAHGNGIWNNHTIHLADTTPPSISGCLTNLSITASPGACDAIVSWTEPAVTDQCPGASITRTAGLPPGSAFPIGTSMVTYEATDGSNTEQCTFQVEVQPTTVDIAYGVTTVCQSSSPILPTIASPPGGVFSDANQPGTIDPTTGAFDPSLATPGLHTLGYVFAGACTSHDWFTINVVARPSATIAYGGSPYCSSAGSAAVTHTGTTGGTFSATAGLVIDPSSGAVDLSTSSPGDHIVTYTIPASGPCGIIQATAPITVTAAPAATISYNGPFCNNSGQQWPTITGATGGTFSSVPTLAIDPNTGVITPGATTASSSGTNFLVTYALPAQEGCPAFVTNTNVIITQAAWAGTGGGLDLCSNTGPVLMTVNGNPSMNGTWTDPADQPHSGTYDPSLDAPGNYT